MTLRKVIKARIVSERRIGTKVGVPGFAQHSATLVRSPELAHLTESFSTPVGRQDRGRYYEGRLMMKSLRADGAPAIFRRFAFHAAGLHFERRIQRQRAVAVVFKSVPLRSAG